MSAATSITVRVPLKIRRRPGRKTVVMPVPAVGSDTTIATRADPALVKALSRAFRYQSFLDEGRYASISEMATAERIERGYLGSLLRLTLLAPDVVEELLNGAQPHGLSFADVAGAVPPVWGDQRALYGRELHRLTRALEPALRRHGTTVEPSTS